MLEFFWHDFSQMGHMDLLVAQNLSGKHHSLTVGQAAMALRNPRLGETG
jgi:hypothetical protein